MAPGTPTASRAGLRWRFVAAALIPAVAGLVSTVPGPQAEAAAGPAGLTAAPACRPLPVTAYVASDSGTVTPIVTRTNTAERPIAANGNPGGIAITPDGKTVYAVGGSGTVTPIATRTNTAGPAISVGLGPENIAITPDGKTAYVTNWGSGTVTPIATRTGTAAAGRGHQTPGHRGEAGVRRVTRVPEYDQRPVSSAAWPVLAGSLPHLLPHAAGLPVT
jgi:DNA-binding beta-propeller fold protein YncE